MVIHTTPTTIAISVATAAPTTPIAGAPSQPKMNTGASTMFRITVAVCTTMPGLKLPVPRSAAPMPMSPNWSAIAGTNHSR